MLDEANIEYERLETELNKLTNKFDEMFQDLEEKVNC